jgi:hypothetical protein
MEVGEGQDSRLAQAKKKKKRISFFESLKGNCLNGWLSSVIGMNSVAQ